MGICWYARLYAGVCTGVRWCVCGYAWVYACVWDEISEFLLENRVPTSADFNTYPIRIFFLASLSLLLLFYGEFSEWAYAFSWIQLFQLVVFLNVAMHFSVSYFSNFSISVEKKIHSVRDFDLKCFISLMISEDGTT